MNSPQCAVIQGAAGKAGEETGLPDGVEVVEVGPPVAAHTPRQRIRTTCTGVTKFLSKNPKQNAEFSNFGSCHAVCALFYMMTKHFDFNVPSFFVKDIFCFLF